MTDKIREQIETVRLSGYCNMLDTTAVQRYAYDHEMWELTCYIEDDRRKYARFIMTGSEEKK